MAAVTLWNFYFRLFPGAIKSPQVVEFLEHLMRHLPGKLLIIWDGLRRIPLQLENSLGDGGGDVMSKCAIHRRPR